MPNFGYKIKPLPDLPPPDLKITTADSNLLQPRFLDILSHFSFDQQPAAWSIEFEAQLKEPSTGPSVGVGSHKKAAVAAACF